MLRDFKGKNGSWRTIKETVLEDYFLNLSFIQQKSLPTWCPNILINSPSPFFNFRNALSLKMCNWFKLWNVFYDSVDFASAPSEKSRVSLTVHVFRKNSEMTSYTRTCWLHVTVIHATRNNWESKKSAKMIHIYLLASVLCGVGGVALLVVGVAALLLSYNRHG